MKKILLLDGSVQQIIAIKTAWRPGYYTVLCDYLTEHPSQYETDKFYLVSITDKDAAFKVAREEYIDDFLAQRSDGYQTVYNGESIQWGFLNRIMLLSVHHHNIEWRCVA